MLVFLWLKSRLTRLLNCSIVRCSMPISENGPRDTDMKLSPSFPEIVMGEPSEYDYIPNNVVGDILGNKFYYGPSKRYVDGLYLARPTEQVADPNKAVAVGVLQVTEDICLDHFEGNPIMRGVDRAEAIAQTMLVYKHLRGEIPGTQVPLLTGLDQFTFEFPAVPGMTVNMPIISTLDGFTGYGRMLAGIRECARGEIRGQLMEQSVADRLMNVVRRRIPNPKFPFQG